MNVLLHSPLFDDTRARLLKAVSLAGPTLTIETFPDVEALSAKLLDPEVVIGLFVIRVVDRFHMKQLFQVRELLRQVRVAIHIPDTHPDTIALAHVFHPRLILCGASSLHELTAVVQKLIDFKGNTGANGAAGRLVSCPAHPDWKTQDTTVVHLDEQSPTQRKAT